MKSVTHLWPKREIYGVKSPVQRYGRRPGFLKAATESSESSSRVISLPPAIEHDDDGIGTAEKEELAKKDMVLPTHAAATTEEPQEKRRRSPLLAGLAALCLVAAVYCTSYYAGHSDEQTDNSRRLEVQEDDGEETDIPDYDLPPVVLPDATVVEAEVDIPGPSSAEPPYGDDDVSLIAQQ